VFPRRIYLVLDQLNMCAINKELLPSLVAAVIMKVNTLSMVATSEHLKPNQKYKRPNCILLTFYSESNVALV
jgi:hypothetical protein